MKGEWDRENTGGGRKCLLVRGEILDLLLAKLWAMRLLTALYKIRFTVPKNLFLLFSIRSPGSFRKIVLFFGPLSLDRRWVVGRIWTSGLGFVWQNAGVDSLPGRPVRCSGF